MLKKLVLNISSSEIDGVPDKVKLLPLGLVKSQKGDFVVDEESFQRIKNTFSSRGIDIVIDYEGSVINFNCDRPSAAELLEDDAAQKRLACFLIKSYCDDIKSGEKEGRCFAHFHYDH